MERKIPKFYFHRIYLLSMIILFLLLFPLAIVTGIKMLPEFAKKLFNEAEKVTNLNLNEEILTESGLCLDADSLFKAILIAPHKEKKALLDLHKKTLINYLTPEKIEAINNRLEALNSSFKLVIIDGRTEFRLKHDTNTSGFKMPIAYILVIIISILFYVYTLFESLKFKRYFNYLRKKRVISEKLIKYVREKITKTPLFMTVSFFIPAMVINILLIHVIYIKRKVPLNIIDLENQFMFVSLLTTLLITLFIYTWQRHRVNNYYLEAIFSAEELKKRVFSFRISKIKDRMIISNVITSILPLLIVFVYIGLSFSYITQPEKLTKQDKVILLGKYSEVIAPFKEEREGNYDDVLKFFIEVEGALGYVNIIDRWLMLVGITSSIIVVFFYIFLFVKWNTLGIVKPVKDLLYSIKQTSSDATNTHYSIVRSDDEIGELTEEFNKMSQQLKDFFTHISSLRDTYYKFVPKQFLNQLQKEEIISIRPGDSIEKELTILFADIRGFTSISEKMSPEENFIFINKFLGGLEPLIQKHQGFVDKYSGDSIMALFPENPKNALRAAKEMFIELKKLNNENNIPKGSSIEIGIGINTGKVMMGIVGSTERMNATVISDCVNTASRFEGLTRNYGTNVIIGEDSYTKLPEHYKSKFRELDIVTVKGKTNTVKIFEYLDIYSELSNEDYQSLKSGFTEAKNLYFKKEFEKAMDIFNKLWCNFNDFPSKVFKERCQNLIDSDVSDFDGIMKFEVK